MDVHQHRVPGGRPPDADGLKTVFRRAADASQFRKQALQNAAVGGVVVHDKHAATGEVGFLGGRLQAGLGRRGGLLQRHGRNLDLERGASGMTPEAEITPHQGCELSADGQAQPRAACRAGLAAVGLDEAVEDVGLPISRDARTGVDDLEGQAVRIPIDQDAHRALLGELDGVGDQIAQHLTQSHLVGQAGARRAGGQVDLEIEPLLSRQLAVDGLDGGGEASHLELGVMQGHLPRLDLRDVEDGVEDIQQPFGGLLHDGEARLLLRRQGLASHDLGHAQHAVERGPDLMAHGGQEFALGPVGGSRGDSQILGLAGELKITRELPPQGLVQLLGGETRADFPQKRAAHDLRDPDTGEETRQADIDVAPDQISRRDVAGHDDQGDHGRQGAAVADPSGRR